MSLMKRYAVYYAPRPGPFADRAFAWLGRDCETGHVVTQPDLPNMPAPPQTMTADPRRYGFHGTLRAPFRPVDCMTVDAIGRSVQALAASLAPVVCNGLKLENLQGFLALTPQGCEAALLELGAAVVEGTDSLRAPLDAADIARRRPEHLTTRQRAHLDRWGYPFVMEEFQFHLTLTNRLPPDQAASVATALQAYLAPVLPQPFVIQDLCLFGEDAMGQFHLLHRYALTG